ncbi:hypothetical protein [Clostridium beijerinckii]|uniref:hypothetical protein n=1 Tax=Clostridium beijerinckii TaxID=1520 RepID=UPI00157130F9|nr:hypothetical protein [Clostridium beijerinckii]NRU52478.1 hypothetical protein [Clostridium beijerinckii]NYC69077.1 hypothetical protein [Clostridium beijerinckii]NYC91663.1 hypothetical protein [Clostridium beijerinckii]NYC91679.1 hypothetical protein [Clostridium beijerinckii]
MFELIDYKEDIYSDGFGAGIDYYYKVRNIKTGESKWVDRYEYSNIKSNGFLKK